MLCGITKQKSCFLFIYTDINENKLDTKKKSIKLLSEIWIISSNPLTEVPETVHAQLTEQMNLLRLSSIKYNYAFHNHSHHST